ncbi:gamma tubulin complex subunit, putative [Bodo saltans]|uniref:Gamma tubulin complex subunit, putative n=1 Tax=Bodo saltans TaxID=75058 RepID=A0A0S4JUQ1_BODSA|nr:gamma tubulin complex subunit, putative [Bodo saltans]|eukprot:CUG92294.1 gamma tubulin complex subunit, putative [Bodo saltans]
MSDPPKHSGSPVASWSRTSTLYGGGGSGDNVSTRDETGAPKARPVLPRSTLPQPSNFSTPPSSVAPSPLPQPQQYVDAQSYGRSSSATSQSGGGGSITFKPVSSGYGVPFSVQSPVKRPSEVSPFANAATPSTPDAITSGSDAGNYFSRRHVSGQQPAPAATVATSQRGDRGGSHFDVPLERGPRGSLPTPMATGGASSFPTVPRTTSSTPPPASSAAHHHTVPALSPDDLSKLAPVSSSLSTRSTTGVALSSSTKHNNGPLHQYSSVGGGGASPPSSNHPAAAAYTRPIDESAFISDLLFLFIGVKRTKYFSFSPESNRFELTSSQEGSLSQRNFLAQVQEPALLALEIDGMLRGGGISGDGGGGELSFLQQSLRAAVRDQMTQYHYFIATLREKPIESLSLMDVLLAAKKVTAKLSVLSLILNETRAAKGGALVTRMEFLTHQGSRRLYELVQHIYVQTVTPLLHMASEWIVTGTAADPFHEFFIKTNASIDMMASDQFWTSCFTVERSMLPTTVSLEVANTILQVGRNIAMITKCCRAKQWQLDPAIAAAARAMTFVTLPQVARDALEVTNKAVMRLVMEQHRLRDVLSVVQKFLLVGHGDFFEMLIRRLDPVLSKMSTAVQSSVVADHVQAALLECTTSSSYGVSGVASVVTSHHQPPSSSASSPTSRASITGAAHATTTTTTTSVDVSDIVLQIVSEMNKVDGFIGWDCFSLSLPLHAPLNNVLDAQSQRVYRKLFKMLFSVKRAEVLLKLSWRQSVVLDRMLARFHVKSYIPSGDKGAPASVHSSAPIPDAELTIWRKVAGDAHLLGLQFNHFVTNLWSYFVSEVSTTAWEKLHRAVLSCGTFDELRQVHGAFLEHLTMHLLLHRECGDVRENILQILAQVRELCAAQQLLTNFLERGTGNIVTISNRYQDIADTFQTYMSALLKLLEDQHAQFDFLNFLYLRLNFNQFYRDTSVNGTNTEF